MIKEALQWARERAHIQLAEINGKTYTKDSLSRIQKDSEFKPESLYVHTLDGLLDYACGLFQNESHTDPGKVSFLVEDEKSVLLIGPMQHDNRNLRFEYARATLIAPNFKFGRYIDQEMFIIELLSKFVQDYKCGQVVSKVASIETVVENKTEDDGFTQRVQFRKGLRLKEEGSLQNPVQLAPYRTFREVEQPVSEFILRFNQDRDGVRAALFEADGSKWRLDAIEKVREYLQERMEDWAPGIIPLPVIS